MKACCIVAMEMSKSPKPRHFSDSSRERWGKNRHEQRTKRCLKKTKNKDEWRKKTWMCVMSVKWCEANGKTYFLVKWWSGVSDGHTACLSAQGNPIISICLHSNKSERSCWHNDHVCATRRFTWILITSFLLLLAYWWPSQHFACCTWIIRTVLVYFI